MVATRQWAARLFWGALLGFLVAMAGWSAVILTMNRNLDTVSFIALWIPVFGFAVLGFAFGGSGLLGALVGAVVAVPVVFGLAPVINPGLGEAGGDSIGFGIPAELVIFMLPAGVIGWVGGLIDRERRDARHRS